MITSELFKDPLRKTNRLLKKSTKAVHGQTSDPLGTLVGCWGPSLEMPIDPAQRPSARTPTGTEPWGRQPGQG